VLQTFYAINRSYDSSLTSCLYSVSFKVTTRIQMIYCIDASRAGALSSLIAGNKLIYVLDPSTLLLVAGPILLTGELGKRTGSSTGIVTDTDTDRDTDRDTNTETVPKYFTRVFRSVGWANQASSKQTNNKETNKQTNREANKLLK